MPSEPLEVIGHEEDTTIDLGPGDYSVQVIEPGQQFADDALAITGRAVCDMVKGGTTLAKAAEELGTTVRELAKNNTARKMLAALREEYELAPEDLKTLVKCTAVKHATSADPKIALDAVKVIAAMPDVGLVPAYAKVSVAIGVFSDETKSVLAGIKDE